jgi:hypothetical protein
MTSKEKREEILEKIKNASSEKYVTEWDDSGRIGTQKKKSNIKKGRTSRAAGARFELIVRKDLNEKEWTVDKWSNNVDLDSEKVIIAKRKFNPFKKILTIGTGFPDFIAFKRTKENLYRLVGVEVKMNGLLSKQEKEKCKILLDKGIFNEIWVAKKEKVGRSIGIEYVDFRERYSKLFQ